MIFQSTIISSIVVFSLIIIILVLIISLAEKKLLPQGDAKILINGDDEKSPKTEDRMAKMEQMMEKMME